MLQRRSSPERSPSANGAMPSRFCIRGSLCPFFKATTWAKAERRGARLNVTDNTQSCTHTAIAMSQRRCTRSFRDGPASTPLSAAAASPSCFRPALNRVWADCSTATLQRQLVSAQGGHGTQMFLAPPADGEFVNLCAHNFSRKCEIVLHISRLRLIRLESQYLRICSVSAWLS